VLAQESFALPQPGETPILVSEQLSGHDQTTSIKFLPTCIAIELTICPWPKKASCYVREQQNRCVISFLNTSTPSPSFPPRQSLLPSSKSSSKMAKSGLLYRTPSFVYLKEPQLFSQLYPRCLVESMDHRAQLGHAVPHDLVPTHNTRPAEFVPWPAPFPWARSCSTQFMGVGLPPYSVRVWISFTLCWTNSTCFVAIASAPPAGPLELCHLLLPCRLRTSILATVTTPEIKVV
jgi:hypothetical protein